MRVFEGTPVCSINQHCSQWARLYLKYCLCSTKDGLALTLGMVSVISWGIAEVPQIITNYKEKSAEGLSVAFLMTWIVGDLFNLTGCLLEPATLPTQFYMALLYTATTLVLTTQTVYYGHIYHRIKEHKISLLPKSHKPNEDDALTKEKPKYNIDENECRNNVYQANGSSPMSSSSSPIPFSAPTVHCDDSRGRDLYYKSARSLSKSPKPTAGIWSSHSRDFGRTPPNRTHDRSSSREPLLGSLTPAQSAPPLTTRNILCVVSPMAFLLCTYGFHLSLDHPRNPSSHGMVLQVGRKLLQVKVARIVVGNGGRRSEIGNLLGWAMAAIYMGGRLPQICLNIRRGNVEGLSPLMFLFALIGNATYVGSILVKSMDWSRIRPNMPWLVDAGGCVLLDAFILLQFVYFHYRKNKDGERSGDN